MISVKECPVCNNSYFKKIANSKDYTVSHETFTIIKCENCELAATSPRPNNKDLATYYQSTEYISHTGKSSGGIGIIYRIARKFSLKRKVKLLSKYASIDSLLDFGCGTGEFLKAAKEEGWRTYGVEPSNEARKKAEVSNDGNVSESIDNLQFLKTSVITAWHVLEHVPDLQQTLKSFSTLLTDKGILIIAVPNYQSPDSEHYIDMWAGYDVPRHLWHFSKKSMIQLLEQNNFRVIEILPMKLDAFYISLLSEKYSNSNQVSFIGLVKAFLSGIKSNLKASKENNYSSLIYIAQI